MNNKGGGTFLVGLVIVLGLLWNSFFILTEGEQAIITQFGKPVGIAKVNAGLQFKIPVIQMVTLLDKRILSWDGYPNQIPTKDKKYIKVDTTARWKIVDPLKFLQTVQNERGAKDRLDAILDAATRDVVSAHNLVEVVRNSNEILTKIAKNKEDPDLDIEDEITGEIERIQVGREVLSSKIVEISKAELEALGIEVVDVQLRRISYEQGVEQKVYERMVSERQRIAQKIRSIGQGERAKIEGRQTNDLKEIQANAYLKVQTIKGKAEAEAISIYASVFNKDPDFFEFIRSLDAYKNIIRTDNKLILSSDNQVFKFMK